MLFRSDRGAGLAQGFGLLRAFGKDAVSAVKLPKAVNQFVGFAKKLPGLSIALGALDFAARKTEGQGTGQAGGGAAGAVAGATLGGIVGSVLDPFIGPFGTILGSMLGSWIGDWLGSGLGKIFDTIGPKLTGLWDQFTTWLSSGFNVGKTFGALTANLENTVDGIGLWFDSL